MKAALLALMILSGCAAREPTYQSPAGQRHGWERWWEGAGPPVKTGRKPYHCWSGVPVKCVPECQQVPCAANGGVVRV